MVQTSKGASKSQWLMFIRRIGRAWKQGKDALLIALLQEILEDYDDVVDDEKMAAYEVTIAALKDVLLLATNADRRVQNT